MINETDVINVAVASSGWGRSHENMALTIRGDSIRARNTLPIGQPYIYHIAKIIRIDLVNGIAEERSGKKHMSKRVVGQPVEARKSRRLV